MLTALIMAGGTGKRFWPLSTEERPKQLLRLTSDKTMIRETVDRILPIIPPERIFIATNIKQVNPIHKELEEIPKDNIIIEPFFKDTAAAIGYGTIYIEQKYPDSEIAVLASDHSIRDAVKFQNIINLAAEEARENNSIVTLGIKPTRPEVGYGYIETDVDICYDEPCRVLGFKEKPDVDTAKEYLEKGNFLWNSGMFIFSSTTILKEYKTNLNKHYQLMYELKASINKCGKNIKEEIRQIFVQFDKISIDFGIMEKSSNIRVIPVDIGWNDVGGFNSLEDVYQEKNQYNSVVKGMNVRELDGKNNVYIGEKSNLNIVSIGLEDIIVVNNGNELLICKKSEAESIKKMV